MINTIVHSKLPPGNKTFHRVFDEEASVTFAGFETTANTLRLILYHIYTNDDILKRLRREVTSVPADSSGIRPLNKLEQLPYLTAVLKEDLRLSPAVATRAARITDKDLFYMNWRIPAGTPVGMTTSLLHTDDEWYPEPMSFRPERWIGSTAQGASDAIFAPFSRGTRVCLGMQCVHLNFKLNQ